eukprot:COSAG02_NODE_63456_length_263_cov_0.628049_1_plen_42_part_01
MPPLRCLERLVCLLLEDPRDLLGPVFSQLVISVGSNRAVLLP